MNRIILLFCICLGVGLLAVHFHKPLVNSVAPHQRAAIKPVNNPSVTATPSAEPIAETVSVQADQNPNLDAGVETAATNIAPLDEKVTEDKYEVLRKLREWAAKDPAGALAATMKLPEGDERNEALTAVCFGLAQTDPAEAVKTAQEL